MRLCKINNDIREATEELALVLSTQLRGRPFFLKEGRRLSLVVSFVLTMITK